MSIRAAVLFTSIIFACSLHAQTKPALEFLFDGSLKNTGSFGGEGKFANTAAGEEARFGEGMMNGCLDMCSTRGGIEDKTVPHGGAVLFPAGALAGASTVTVIAAIYPAVVDDLPRRIVTLSPLLQIYAQSGAIVLAVGNSKNEIKFHSTGIPVAAETPAIIAVVCDAKNRNITAYQFKSRALVKTFSESAMPDNAVFGGGVIEIGNAGGIRAFKGYIDSVRIYASALPENEIASVMSADRKAFTVPASGAAPIEEAAVLARIDIDASATKEPLTYVSGASGVRGEHPSWGDEKTRPQRLTVEFPCNLKTWTPFRFQIQTGDAGILALRFMGPYSQGSGSRPHFIPVLFDDVKIEGAAFVNGDMEWPQQAAWEFLEQQRGQADFEKAGFLHDEKIAHSGKTCLRVWTWVTAHQRLKVGTNQLLTISGWVRQDETRSNVVLTGIPPKGSVPSGPVFFASIENAANMGFADAQAGDGKGGWSDQGPENDFKEFDLQASNFGGVPFRIVNPLKNQGRSILTFRSEKFPAGIQVATVPVEAKKARFLYLLHTTCWNESKSGTPVGTIRLRRANRDEKVIEVQSGREVSDWWTPRGLPNGAPVEKKDNGSARVGVFLSRFPLEDQGLDYNEISFETSETSIWIVLGATLTCEDYPLPSQENFVFAENKEWKPFQFTNDFVLPGSALDWSRLVAEGPAGRWGRVRLGAKGGFEFTDRPGERIIFRGAAVWLSKLLYPTERLLPYCASNENFLDKRVIDSYVDEWRRRGFNLLRIDSIEETLRRDVEARPDFEMNPIQLDRLDYLISRLKQNGIYLYLDACQDWGGYQQNAGPSWEYKNPQSIKTDLRPKLFVDEGGSRKIWATGVRNFLTRTNRYTGTRLIDDPVLAVLNPYNEQDGSLSYHAFSPDWQKVWQDWLKRNVHDEAGLRAALTDEAGKCWLASGEDIGHLEASMKMLSEKNPRGLLMTRFLLAVETEMSQWYARTLRGLGYRGVLSAVYDVRKNLHYAPLRTLGDVVSQHGYYGVPMDRRMQQGSSLRSKLDYLTSIAATRLVDRPFLVTEYKHGWWNRYHYEEGLAAGALFALQDYDMMIAHCDPVYRSRVGIPHAYVIGPDPVARAAELLTGFIFANRAVSQSTNLLCLQVQEKDLLEQAALSGSAINTQQANLSLVARFGIAFEGLPGSPWATRKTAVRALIPLAGGSEVLSTMLASTALENTGREFDADAFTENLKRAGILNRDNRTRPKEGRFESDTGEIYLSARENLLTVQAPQCIGFNAEAGQKQKLGPVMFEGSTVRAGVAIVSLDRVPIPRSHRLLVFYLTDSQNTGATYDSDDCVQQLKGGGNPVLLRTGRLAFALEHEQSEKMRAWALGATGERVVVLPLTQTDGKLRLEVDTARLACGPTTFFEIALP
ncbi:MAG: LamG-like jellyroll fold domain-containing protein [Spirochaetota bacterium]